MMSDATALCVVTGGCGPLGWAISTRMARGGSKVLAVDLPSAVQQRRAEVESLPITFMPLDLMQPEAPDIVTEAVIAQGSGLNVLVNNAAFTGGSAMRGYACAFDEQADDAFDAAVTLNLAVPFRLARRLAPHLRLCPNSSIINIASIYGLVGPDMGLYAGTSMGNPAGYAASKGGLVQLTRYLATVLAPQVRVNCVAPGGLAREQDAEFVARYLARTPMGRMGAEQDVSEAVSWFASDAASYVTGQVLAIDGGWTAW